MATTIAALKGRLGNTEYFIVAMKAKELVERAVIPSKMIGWGDLTLEEEYQREINYDRVRKQIAPYLATQEDRFFGAIILAAKNLKPSYFEPIGKLAEGLPKLYQSQAKLMGFLTLDGGEELFPLDGQHRLKAIQFAITGRDHKDTVIPTFEPSQTLANDEVTVIIVPYDNKKARKIFTKVNRYAKSPTTGQNLVIDDDDFVAVSSRGIANKLFSSDLVKYKSNTLNDKDPHFTTLATIASCNDFILKESFPAFIRSHPVDDIRLRNQYSKKIEEVWNHVTKNIEEFSQMLSDKTKTGNRIRQDIRSDNLLGKPAAQTCLIMAFVKMVNSNNFSPMDASTKLNKIDWSKNDVLWDRLLISGSKILTKNIKVAADIVCYVCGDKCDEKLLLKNYQKLFPAGNNKQFPAGNNKQLPPKV